MKRIIIATLLVAFAMPAAAGDSWRSPGKSLYGGPSGDANSLEFQNRARLDQALRDGTAGYVGDTAIVSIQTTAGGCISTQTVGVDKSDGNNVESKIGCTNSGDVNANTTVNVGKIGK